MRELTVVYRYLICGIVLLHKNPNDQKSVKYLDTGLEFFTSTPYFSHSTNRMLTN